MVIEGGVRRSPAIASLAGALAKAQGEIAGAAKDKTNPHFKSAYADLASVWDACRAPLSKNALAVMQPASANGPHVTVTTILTHSSGEWVESDLTMTAQQNTPQGIGSCITYARRYALASMVGIAPEDDDGNAASQGNGSAAREYPKPTTKAAAPSVPPGYDNWLIDLTATADNGTDALQKAWKASQPFLRKHLLDTDSAAWEALKVRAAKTEQVPA
jgi:hypothetical protein